MKKHAQKPLALLLAIIIAFSSLVSAGTVANAAGVQQTLASWSGFKDSSFPSFANGGNQKDNAELTTSAQGTFFVTGTGLSAKGWNIVKDSNYWEISLSSKGFDSLVLSAQTRSSKTGPREWTVQCSTEGGEFIPVSGSDYNITEDGKLKNWMKDLPLPSQASNQDYLKIRFTMRNNTSVNGASVLSDGNNYINHVFVYGTPVTDPNVVNGVVADPAGGSAVAFGQELSLNCETTDATIKYKMNDGAEQVYDSGHKPKLDKLPATVVAYAMKDGLTESVPTTFQYTQATVDSVTAKPNGGSIKAGDLITLKCPTPDSSIQYSVDDGATWKNYSDPFAAEKLPVTVLAKASAAGKLDSVQTKFIFSERVNANYNIYFGQLHSHTNSSDGIGTVEEAFNHAATKVDNLDFLAVTDHSNSLEETPGIATLEKGSSSEKWSYGKKSAQAINDKKIPKGDHTFLGLYGFEMTWSNGIGHINTFNTNGFENRNAKQYKDANALSTYYTRLEQNPNSISQFNHPGNKFGDFNDFANYNPQIDKLITMIEVGNGEGPIRSSGYFPSYEYYTRALDKGWHVAPTNNQDNHQGKWGNANTARSVILADTLTEDSLYDAMRNRRMYATEDNNLKIEYKLNDEVMGTILESKPDDVKINVKLSDPDKEAIGKVDVVVNGGKVAATQNVTSSEEVVSFQLPADYSYYYIRVTQPDKDIAVTAPVWVGEVTKAGLSKTTSSAALPIKGEELTITSSLYNNESAPMDVTSLEYSIDGTVIESTDKIGEVGALSTKDYSFKYTSAKAGACSVNVKLTATINNVEKVFTDVLKLNFFDPKIVTKVLIDGTHRNDYVNGYYANNMDNFIAIAAAKSIQVKIEETQITKEMLDETNLLIISAPAKEKQADKITGISYDPQTFSTDFIAMIKDYVANGGTVITCGLADFKDNKTDPYTASTQINDLLKEIGATTSISSDEVMDDVNYGNASQPFRLFLTNGNKDSLYLQGVVEGQKYSFFSGCSVTPGENATWLVKGHDTTYSINSLMSDGKYESKDIAQSAAYDKKTGIVPYDANKAVKKKGEVCVLAQEKVGKGNVFVGGTVFMSNFEVKAEKDNNADLPFMNFTIVNNILDSIKREIPTTKIADVRKQPIGEAFAVEGVVTAGTQAGNAFFDTIYVQDETGGINIFPINSGDIQVGQKVSVVGSVDEYLGDLELRVISAKVVDTAIKPLSPVKLTTQQAADYAANGGKLVQVQGKVTKVVLENNIVSYALIKDNSGAEARVFIDGYIGSSKQMNQPLESFVQVGKMIRAIGLVSHDPDGARIRVRDRAEIQEVNTDTSRPSKPSKSSNSNIIPAATFMSDTTTDLNGKDTYELKITSTNGQVPTLVIGTGGVFTTQLVKTSGSDYYFKLIAIGTTGAKAGVYVNGVKLLVATVGANSSDVKSDTTYPFKVKSNSSYIFKITAVSKPAFVAGTSSAFKVEFVKTEGNNHFFKVTAIGKSGEACGFYMNSQKTPVAVATISK
jgi:hypothetical protein